MDRGSSQLNGDHGPTAARWAPRPRLATAVAVLAALAPVLAGAAAGLVAGRLLPHPGRAAWWIGVVVAGLLASFVVGRLARRLVPLAALLRLSLGFPGAVPSRFRIALRAGSSRRLLSAMADGPPSDAGEAAHRVLELVAALSAHDPVTRGHSERVRAYAELVAAELGVDGRDLDRLRWSALLHDVGKLAVPAHVLNHDGPLDDEQWEVIRRHPEEGDRLAAPLRPWLGPWADAIVQHHERWDGLGYPAGLRAEQLSLGARIVAVADAFEVMTALRSYQKPRSAAAAREELGRVAGTQLDPRVVRAFLQVGLAPLRAVQGIGGAFAGVPGAALLARVRPGPVHASLGVLAAAALAAGLVGGPEPSRTSALATAGATTTTVGGAGGGGTGGAQGGGGAAGSGGAAGAAGLQPGTASQPGASTTVATLPDGSPAPTTTGPPATDSTGQTLLPLPTFAPRTSTTVAGATTTVAGQTTTTTKAGTTTTKAPTTTTTTAPAGAFAPANDSASVSGGGTVTIDVVANDGAADGSTLRFTNDASSMTTTSGTVSVVSGKLRYTRTKPGSNADAFTYKVCKLGAPATCGTATVTVTVA